MGKEQKTEKMLCMQVVNEHHRQQDVWSWRKLNQWSPFTCIQSSLQCLKVFSSKTGKTDGGSKRTGENLCWSKRKKGNAAEGTGSTLTSTEPSSAQAVTTIPDTLTISGLYTNTNTNMNHFWLQHRLDDQIWSEHQEGKNRIPVTSNTHRTWLLRKITV